MICEICIRREQDGNGKHKIKCTARDRRPRVQGPRLEVWPENNTVGDMQVLVGNSLKVC